MSVADVAAGGPATVVLLQAVHPEATEAYRVWQDQTNAVAAGFPGFVGVEVTPPSDIQTDWLVVYRFATQAELRAWLTSADLAGRLTAGAQYFASPPRQVTATDNQAAGAQAVSVIIRHHIRPGREEAYRVWQQKLAEAESQAPGYLGSELIPPGPGSEGVWSAILRFDNADNLNAWMSNPARQKLVDDGKKIYQDFDATPVRGGFDGWFGFGQGGAVVAVPPVWKQALSVLVALYPTVMVLSLLVTNHIKWDLPQVILVANIMSTILLSWVLMPIVNRLLGFWLKPASSNHLRTDITGVVIIAVALVAMMLIFQVVSPYLPS